MIFPLWKFWTYTPLGFLAAVVWNLCEIFNYQCPFCHILFEWIMGYKGDKKDD